VSRHTRDRSMVTARYGLFTSVCADSMKSAPYRSSADATARQRNVSHGACTHR
jgi:hypothetical protein